MAVGDTITISGLTGTATADAGSLAIGGAAAGKFSVGGVASKGAWTQSTGTLVLTASGTETADQNIVVTVDLAEPTLTQSAVSAKIATNFVAGALAETALTGSVLVYTAPAAAAIAIISPPAACAVSAVSAFADPTCAADGRKDSPVGVGGVGGSKDSAGGASRGSFGQAFSVSVRVVFGRRPL